MLDLLITSPHPSTPPSLIGDDRDIYSIAILDSLKVYITTCSHHVLNQPTWPESWKAFRDIDKVTHVSWPRSAFVLQNGQFVMFECLPNRPSSQDIFCL